MKEAKSKRHIRKLAAVVVLVLVCALVWQKADRSFSGLWRTPARQAQLLMEREQYLEAAELFSDPMRRGEALYKAGEFKRALLAYNTVSTIEGVYNRANTQMMLGKYDAAIELYDKVLVQRPDWQAATVNRGIALARKLAMAPPEDGGEGTGGKLEADEIVFDDRAKNNKGSETVEANQGEAMEDDEMRALWLRKVQTKPADFLRAKFSYQHQRDQAMKGEKP